MKTTKLHVIIILMVMTLFSCKKDVQSNPPEIPAKTDISKIRSWYEKQKHPLASQAKDGENLLPESSPQWSGVKYYTYPDHSVYVIPMDINAGSTTAHTNQFIVIHTNESGIVIKSEYVFYLLDVSNPRNVYDKDKLANLSPEAIDFTSIPDSLCTWVVKYDFDYVLKESKYLDQQTAISNGSKLAAHIENKAPTPSCQTPLCIDWYYQIYENGVLIYEEYLYTTCSCADNPGGGGGPNPSPSPGSTCSLSMQEAQNMLNQLSYSDLYAGSYQLGPVIHNEDFPEMEIQDKNYEWDFVKLNYGLGYDATWTGIYTGKRTRMNPASSWKWQQFNFSRIEQTKGEIPPCFQSTISYSHSEFIKPDGTSSATLNYTIITKCTCAWGTQIGPPWHREITDPQITAND